MSDIDQTAADDPALKQPIFNIEKIYIKDLSLEMPGAPKIFLSNEQPEVEVNIHTEASVVDPGALYEVVLTATVTAKTTQNTVFLIEVAQAGLFHIRNLPPQDLEAVLAILCPTTLLPYAREAVAGIASRASLPPVTLKHMDFNQIYAQAQQQRNEPTPQASQVN